MPRRHGFKQIVHCTRRISVEGIQVEGRRFGVSHPDFMQCIGDSAVVIYDPNDLKEVVVLVDNKFFGIVPENVYIPVLRTGDPLPPRVFEYRRLSFDRLSGMTRAKAMVERLHRAKERRQKLEECT